MSGIKDLNLTLFYRKLRHRRRPPRTAGQFAAKIVSGRTHVTEVFNGTADSPRTRARLAPLLTPVERALLGWDRAGAIVPRGTESADRHLQPAEASA